MVGISIVIGSVDAGIREIVQSNGTSSTDGIARVVSPFGKMSTTLEIAGGFYLFGILTKSERSRDTAIMAIEAGYLSGALTGLIKRASARGRPYLNDGPADFGEPFDGDRGQNSFPSLHTTLAFSLASVIASQYENRWVDITMYGLAGLVGWARLHDDAHWASDVFFGAVVGTVVGRTLVKLHHRRISSARLNVTPMLNSEFRGVGVSKSF